jgi:urease accessory protein
MEIANSEPLKIPKRWDASLCLEFTKIPQSSKTILSKRDHFGPLLIQKSLYPEGDEVCHAVILHPPAGIAGGDHLKIDIRTHPQAKAVVTTPGATKWYKSNGLLSSQQTKLSVASGGHLDFLPQENIYFNASNAHNLIDIQLGEGASMIGWDIAQLGRTASGEIWSDAHLRNELQLSVNDRSFWVDSSILDSGDSLMGGSPKLGPYSVMGTMWFCGNQVSEELLEQVRDSLLWSDTLRVGATRINLPQKNGLIIVRAISSEVEYLKDCFIQMWLRYRLEVSGIPPLPLRLWKT